MMRRRAISDLSLGTGRKMIGNYEVVDLGLPSGLLWATCNIGANEEAGYGNYYTNNQAFNAAQTMGSGWRLPTKDECQELLKNTRYQWVNSLNGRSVRGGKFTSKTNPNAYIFLPAAGRYAQDTYVDRDIECYVWSSTYAHSGSHNYLGFRYGYEPYVSYNYDDHGQSVRGVHAAV